MENQKKSTDSVEATIGSWLISPIQEKQIKSKKQKKTTFLSVSIRVCGEWTQLVQLYYTRNNFS